MSSVITFTLLTEVFVTLFVIMDPVGTIPIFLSLTRGRSQASVRRAAARTDRLAPSPERSSSSTAPCSRGRA